MERCLDLHRLTIDCFREPAFTAKSPNRLFVDDTFLKQDYREIKLPSHMCVYDAGPYDAPWLLLTSPSPIHHPAALGILSTSLNRGLLSTWLASTWIEHCFVKPGCEKLESRPSFNMARDDMDWGKFSTWLSKLGSRFPFLAGLRQEGFVWSGCWWGKGGGWRPPFRKCGLPCLAPHY